MTPIDYSPSKMLYLASMGYGTPKISVVFVYRETEKMYMVIPGATRDLIGDFIMIRGLSRIKKNRVHASETLLEALQWLWKAAVEKELELQEQYTEAVALVEQLEMCIDRETEQPGVIEETLIKCFAKREVQE